MIQGLGFKMIRAVGAEIAELGRSAFGPDMVRNAPFWMIEVLYLVRDPLP
jgi:hypothetical protein